MFSRVANAIVRFILILTCKSEDTWLANLLPSLNSFTNLILLFYCPAPYLLDTCGDGKKGENEELLNAFMGVLLTKTPSKIFPLWERISAKSYVTQPRVWVSNVTALAIFYIEFFFKKNGDKRRACPLQKQNKLLSTLSGNRDLQKWPSVDDSWMFPLSIS